MGRIHRFLIRHSGLPRIRFVIPAEAGIQPFRHSVLTSTSDSGRIPSGFARMTFCFIFFLSSIFFLLSSISLASSQNYSTLLSNFDRTAMYYAVGPKENLDGSLSLSFKSKLFGVDDAVSYPYGVAVDNEGNIYTPVRYKLIKFNSLGEKLWEYSIDPRSSFVLYAPLLYEDKIYFIGSYGTHHLFCLDRETGALVFKVNLRQANDADGLSFMVSPFVVDETVYVQSLSPLSIRGYNKDTGELIGVRVFPQFSIPYLNLATITSSDNIAYSTAQGEIGTIIVKNLFKENIDTLMSPHLLFLYSNNLNPQGASGSSSLSNITLHRGAEGSLFVFANNQGGGISKLYKLNETLQKERSGEADVAVEFTGSSNSNIAVDREGNLYVDVKNSTGNSNTLYSYDKDLNQRWTKQLSSHQTLPNIIVDAKNNVFMVSGWYVYKISGETGEEKAKYKMDYWSTITPIMDKQGNLIVVDNHGTIYSFKGEGEWARCTRKYYCVEEGDTIDEAVALPEDEQPKPLHNPVVLIHGLGGSYKDWIDGNKKEVKEQILAEYWKTDIHFPSDWVYAYHYGYDAQGKYNYEGDVKQISKGLLETVARLSKEHIEAGGDGRVDLVGFSLGGLVIRQYLASSLNELNNPNDDYSAPIRKAVLIGTPNKGSWVMSEANLLKSFPFLGPPMEQGIAEAVEAYQKTINPDQPLHAHTYATAQITPGSDFLNHLDNKDLLPENIDYYIIGANIKARRGGELYGLDNWTEYNEMGDIALDKESWEYLPREPKETIVYDDTVVIKWELAEIEGCWTIRADVPKLETAKMAHWSMMQQPKVRQDIARILSGQ